MYDVVIIGAGPAGGSAAIFAAKAGKKVALIDHDKSITKRALLNNHYGIKQIEGPDLVEIGIEQAKSYGAEYISDKVVSIAKHDDVITIQSESGSYEASHVIIATGMLADIAKESGINTTDGTEPRVKTIIAVDEQGKTNIDGVWAAGTVAGVSVHTIITSGHGAAVAINVISELNGERYVDHDVLS